MVYLSSLVAAALVATVSVSGIPLSARQDKPFSLKNGQDAQAQKYVETFETVDRVGY